MKTVITFALIILCVYITYRIIKAIEQIMDDNFNGPPAY